MTDPDVYRRLERVEKWIQQQASAESVVPVAGTWSPTYYGGTTAGTVVYVDRTGNYILIGNICIYSFRLEWNTATGTGEIRVGMPFVCGGVNFIAPVYPNAVAYLGDYVIGQMIAGNDYMNFRSPTSAGTFVVNVDAAGTLVASGIYVIA